MQDNTNKFEPYLANESFSHSYILIPLELMLNPMYANLSIEAKFLYGFLLNRFKASYLNNWRDKQGRLYIIFSRKEAEKLLNKSKNIVTRVFKELADVNLIIDDRQGKSKANHIYIGKTMPVPLENIMSPKIYDSRVSENGNHESQNMGRNNKNINNKNKNRNKANFIQREYESSFFDQFYANLKGDNENEE